MENKNQPLPISMIFSRTILGFGSGFAGSVILGIVLFASWSVVGDAITGAGVQTNEFGIAISQTQTHPLFLSLVTLAVFLSVLGANLILTLLLCLVDEKYRFQSTMLTQVFFGNLGILFLMLPLYLILNGTFSTGGAALAGILHAVLAHFYAFWVAENLNQPSEVFLNSYGFILGIIIFTAFSGLLFGGSPTILVFLALPILHASTSFANALAEVFYRWVYRTYGTDFLNISTRFGADYGQKDSEVDSDI